MASSYTLADAHKLEPHKYQVVQGSKQQILPNRFAYLKGLCHVPHRPLTCK